MQRLILNVFLGFILVFSLSACDSGSDDDGDGDGGGNDVYQATVTISGDATDSYSGFAAFAADDDADGGFVIFIYQGQFSVVPNGRVLVVGRDAGSPAEGTFPVDDDAFYGTYASDLGSVTTGTFVTGETGQVTISSVSSDRITGSFSFTGELVQSTAVQGTATVSATFTAERLQPGVIPGFF